MFTPPQNVSREASGNCILAVVKIYHQFNKQMILKCSIPIIQSTFKTVSVLFSSGDCHGSLIKVSLTEGVNQNIITHTVLSKAQVVKSLDLHHNWVQTQRCPCGICGEQTAQQQGFFQVLWLSLPIIIPTVSKSPVIHHPVPFKATIPRDSVPGVAHLQWAAGLQTSNKNEAKYVVKSFC